MEQADLIDRRIIHKSSLAAKLRECGAFDLAEPLEECHTQQGFAQCQGCLVVKPFWNRCDNFYCPVCVPRLTHERVQSILWWTKQVSQPKHVVLTIPNTEHITYQQIRQAKSALTKLRHRKIARFWRGGTWSLEITNSGNGWHLHFHLLIDADWIDLDALRAAWADCNSVPVTICWVGDARGEQRIAEATKYVVKGSKLAALPGHDIAECLYALLGHKTFGVFGSLYGKRTEWAKWIAANAIKQSTCSCGCNNWKVYSESEWLWKQTTDAPINWTTARTCPPEDPAQLALRGLPTI